MFNDESSFDNLLEFDCPVEITNWSFGLYVKLYLSFLTLNGVSNSAPNIGKLRKYSLLTFLLLIVLSSTLNNWL